MPVTFIHQGVIFTMEDRLVYPPDIHVYSSLGGYSISWYRHRKWRMALRSWFGVAPVTDLVYHSMVASWQRLVCEALTRCPNCWKQVPLYTLSHAYGPEGQSQSSLWVLDHFLIFQWGARSCERWLLRYPGGVVWSAWGSICAAQRYEMHVLDLNLPMESWLFRAQRKLLFN